MSEENNFAIVKDILIRQTWHIGLQFWTCRLLEKRLFRKYRTQYLPSTRYLISWKPKPVCQRHFLSGVMPHLARGYFFYWNHLHFIFLHWIHFHFIFLHWIHLHFIFLHLFHIYWIFLHWIDLNFIFLHWMHLHFIILHWIHLHFVFLH